MYVSAPGAPPRQPASPMACRALGPFPGARVPTHDRGARLGSARGLSLRRRAALFHPPTLPAAAPRAGASQGRFPTSRHRPTGHWDCDRTGVTASRYYRESLHTVHGNVTLKVSS